MADKSRTLKLSILADIDDLKKKLTDADQSVGQSATGIEKFSKMATAAFAVAGTAALAYTKQAVENAIEDESSQRKLIETIKASTTASAAQTKAVSDYIDKTSLAIGVTDDQLRPALSRLIRSTNDTQKAQELLNLALDISTATGKPLEEVSNALGKAYDGNTNALGRMGLGLDASTLKSKDFDKVYQDLTKTFGNFAENEAQSTEKQIARLKIAFDEFQEGIGYMLLPVITKLAVFLQENLIPAFEFVKKYAIDPVVSAIQDNWDTFKGFFDFLSKTLVPFIGGTLALAIAGLGKAAGFIVEAVAAGIRALEPIINAAITGINLVIRGINLIKPGNDIAYIPKLNTSAVSASTPAVKVPTFTPTVIPTDGGGGGGTGAGSGSGTSGSNSAAASAAANAAASALNVGNAPTSISTGSYLSTPTAPTPISSGSYLSGSSVTVNIGVVGDPESAARTITDIVQQSIARGTGGLGGLLEL